MHDTTSPHTNDTGAPEHWFLSRGDVERLLEDNSIDSRVEVAQKITQQYTDDVFNAQERLYAEQIFRLLMRDSEMRVRQVLATQLEHAQTAPRDVILSLAHDHERIAVPLLRSSHVLSDADLIRIVEGTHAISKIDAVATRESVSQRVSHALIETNYPRVIKSLLGNEGAHIAPKDFDLILNDHQQDEHITQALAARPNLPLPVVERVLHMVSEQVAQSLRQKYNIETQQVSKQSQESMLMEFVSAKASDAEISETINQMYAFDRLTSSVLLSALCRGHLRFFEIGMAKLANIPKSNARKLVRDKGLYGFEALYEKAQMPSSFFGAVKLLLDAVLTLQDNTQLEVGSKLYIGMLIERMQDGVKDEPVENFDYLIELVRRSNSANA